MPLILDGKGAFTAPDNNENNMFTPISATLANWSAKIFLDNMGASDTVTIRVYSDDPQAGSDKLLYTFTYTGVQATSVFVFPIQGSDYKITIQQSAGTLRTFNWARYKQ